MELYYLKNTYIIVISNYWFTSSGTLSILTYI